MFDRKLIRLKGYDYSQAGFYYMTICTYKRKLLFGEIIHNCRGTACCALNKYGEIVRKEWEKTSRLRNNITLDEYIVMPNHIHGIIILHESGTARRAPTGQFGKPVTGSLSTIIRSFKSAVTKRINEIRNIRGTPVWQRSFYDHIIRNEKSLHKIREYILNNVIDWENDSNYVKE